MTVPEMAPWSRLFSATEPATTHSMHVLTPGRSLIGDGGHRLGCPLPVTTHSRWQLPAAPLCRRQLAVSVRAQQAATLEKLKTPAPTPSIAEGEDKSIWKTTYDISNEDPRLTATWKKTIRVAVSGAAGQISNHLLFMLASGEVFGHDQPIALQMLGSERSAGALEGVAMELEDSLYPLLREVQISIDAEKAFADADWALLIGAKPRGPGMERRDLLDLNGQIFELQGKALDKVAKKDVKVMVVGNPCNTNALIALMNAPTLNPRNFHALTRLDENRAKCQLALRAGKFYTSVDRVCIWGNHSTTQVPDFLNARISGEPALDVIGDEEWLQTSFTNTVATRGGALIKKWGRSSAASTAVSIADAIKSLVTPTKPGDVFSSGVLSNGNPYGVADGLVYSFPCRSKGDGDYEIVDDFIIDDFLRQKLKISEDELLKERGCVGHLIPGDEAAACEITVDTMLPGEN